MKKQTYTFTLFASFILTILGTFSLHGMQHAHPAHHAVYQYLHPFNGKVVPHELMVIDQATNQFGIYLDDANPDIIFYPGEVQVNQYGKTYCEVTAVSDNPDIDGSKMFPTCTWYPLTVVAIQPAPPAPPAGIPEDDPELAALRARRDQLLEKQRREKIERQKKALRDEIARLEAEDKSTTQPPAAPVASGGAAGSGATVTPKRTKPGTGAGMRQKVGQGSTSVRPAKAGRTHPGSSPGQAPGLRSGAGSTSPGRQTAAPASDSNMGTLHSQGVLDPGTSPGRQAPAHKNSLNDTEFPSLKTLKAALPSGVFTLKPPKAKPDEPAGDTKDDTEETVTHREAQERINSLWEQYSHAEAALVARQGAYSRKTARKVHPLIKKMLYALAHIDHYTQYINRKKRSKNRSKISKKRNECNITESALKKIYLATQGFTPEQKIKDSVFTENSSFTLSFEDIYNRLCPHETEPESEPEEITMQPAPCAPEATVSKSISHAPVSAVPVIPAPSKSNKKAQKPTGAKQSGHAASKTGRGGSRSSKRKRRKGRKKTTPESQAAGFTLENTDESPAGDGAGGHAGVQARAHTHSTKTTELAKILSTIYRYRSNTRITDRSKKRLIASQYPDLIKNRENIELLLGNIKASQNDMNAFIKEVIEKRNEVAYGLHKYDVEAYEFRPEHGDVTLVDVIKYLIVITKHNNYAYRANKLFDREERIFRRDGTSYLFAPVSSLDQLPGTTYICPHDQKAYDKALELERLIYLHQEEQTEDRCKAHIRTLLAGSNIPFTVEGLKESLQERLQGASGGAAGAGATPAPKQGKKPQAKKRPSPPNPATPAVVNYPGGREEFMRDIEPLLSLMDMVQKTEKLCRTLINAERKSDEDKVVFYTHVASQINDKNGADDSIDSMRNIIREHLLKKRSECKLLYTSLEPLTGKTPVKIEEINVTLKAIDSVLKLDSYKEK